MTTFGCPTLLSPTTAPKPARAKVPRAQRLASTCEGAKYDCGKHGQLTVLEIAAITGTSKRAIYKRIRKGIRGEKLCEPRWARMSDIRRASPPRRHILVCALRILSEFPDRLPDPEDIQRIRPMSLQNAQVWRQALATARNEAQEPPRT